MILQGKMQQEEILKFKTIIENKIKSLYGKRFDLDVDEQGDEADLAQSAFIIAMSYGDRDRYIEKLNLLNEALERIKDGVYGLCEECEEEIELKRLNILPEVRYCIKCAEDLERKRKNFRQ